MSVTWLFLATAGAPIGRVLWLVILFLWPAVIVCTHNMAISRREALLIAGLYLLFLCLVGLFVLVRNSEVSAVELVVNWMTINLPASVLFLAFLHKRVRAVGPLVFAFMLAGVTGALLLVQLIGTSDASLRATASLGTAIGRRDRDDLSAERNRVRAARSARMGRSAASWPCLLRRATR